MIILQQQIEYPILSADWIICAKDNCHPRHHVQFTICHFTIWTLTITDRVKIQKTYNVNSDSVVGTFRALQGDYAQQIAHPSTPQAKP